MAFHNFEDILDECVLSLQRGESVDSCLARYPRQADRLRPLLDLADKVNKSTRPMPRPMAQVNSWNRVRQRATELRAGKNRVIIPRTYSGGHSAWWRPLAIAAAVVCAVMAGGGGTALAAQSSLPDSPLYRVKLATEDARLLLVFDETREAEILIDQSAERTEEIESMLAKGKPISGNVLSALSDRNERAAEILQDQPEQTTLAATLQHQAAKQEDLLLTLWINISSSARSDYTEAVASVHNTRLGQGSGAVVIRPEELAAGVQVYEGLAEQIGQDLWTVGGVEVRVDSSTIGTEPLQAGSTARFVVGKSSRGDLRALSFSRIQSDQPPTGSVVFGEVEEINDDGVRIAGQFIRFDSNTIRSDLKKGEKAQVTIANTPDGPAASSVREDDEELTFTFEGAMEGDIKNNEVKVGGLTFSLPSNTKIDLRAGRAKNGARVIVDATNDDGEYVARSLTVLAAASAPVSAYIVGSFQGTDDGLWEVSGLLVVPLDNAEVPAEESLLAIEATLLGGEIQADRVSVLQTPEDTGLARYQGAIIKIDGSLWSTEFGGVRVTSIAETAGGEAAVGARVLVWSRPGHDGTLVASYARVLDQTSVITTPTPVGGE